MLLTMIAFVVVMIVSTAVFVFALMFIAALEDYTGSLERRNRNEMD